MQWLARQTPDLKKELTKIDTVGMMYYSVTDTGILGKKKAEFFQQESNHIFQQLLVMGSTPVA